MNGADAFTNNAVLIYRAFIAGAVIFVAGYWVLGKHSTSALFLIIVSVC